MFTSFWIVSVVLNVSPNGIMMDESFTHSLYIGRDKTLEVARRRQAVERELREKCVVF